MTYKQLSQKIVAFTGRQLQNNKRVGWGIVRILLSLAAFLVWSLGFMIILIVISKFRYTQNIPAFPLMLALMIGTGLFYLIIFHGRK